MSGDLACHYAKPREDGKAVLNFSPLQFTILHQVNTCMRQPGVACQQCRLGKRKCDRPVNTACQACLRRQLPCTSATRPRTNAALKPASPDSGNRPRRQDDADTGTRSCPAAVDALATLGHAQVSQLVEYYIDYIHDKPHTLFHVPSLRSDVASDKIDKTLLCSILALIARFSDNPEVANMGSSFAMQAKIDLQSELEQMSLTSIQAWIVLGNAVAAEQNYASESLFFGIAIRTARILGFGKPDPEDGAVMREVKSRVWWSLFMLDRWSSAGLGTPRQMYDRHPSQQLPRMESIFHSLEPEQQAWPRAHDTMGLWAYMITLVETFGPIQDVNRHVATGDINESDVSTAVSKISGELDAWERYLPDNIQLRPQTLASHAENGQGRTFVALHLGYYHYATLLFFQYLDASAAGLAYANIYAQRCREHASAFSDLLRTSHEVAGCDAVYNIVGHMAMVSSSVLIHTLMFGEEDELDLAKARLESNFKALMRLKIWWPCVNRMVDKLFMFQKACLRAADNHTHRIDRWMVKFLLELGNNLSEKGAADTTDTPSPQSVLGESAEMLRLRERDRFTKLALTELRS